VESYNPCYDHSMERYCKVALMVIGTVQSDKVLACRGTARYVLLSDSGNTSGTVRNDSSIGGIEQ